MARKMLGILWMRGIGRRFVYVLRSDVDPTRHYVGTTSNVDDRLEWHNHGPCGYTVEYRPWSLVVVVEFQTEAEAVRFERYLKSGSGRAFAKRHFAPAPAVSPKSRSDEGGPQSKSDPGSQSDRTSIISTISTLAHQPFD